MKDKDASAGPAGSVVSQVPESISRAVLGTIAEATTHYPSAVPLPNPADAGLFRQVMGLLAQEGLVNIAGDSTALTTQGYEAVQQAGRTDHRLPEFLRSGALAEEPAAGSLLLLTILQAHFQLQSRRTGKNYR
jgi:hypothetical protein